MPAFSPIEVDKEAAKAWLKRHEISVRQAAEYAGIRRVYLDQILYAKASPRPLKHDLWWRIVAGATLAETQIDIVDHTSLEVPPADGRTWDQIAAEQEAKEAARAAKKAAKKAA